MIKPTRFEKIFYPSFFSSEIHGAFVHAHKISLKSKALLQTISSVNCPSIDGWISNSLRCEGDRTDTIVQVAEAIDADMIAMTADVPDRFPDGLRATISERALRKACCAVAVVPVEPMRKSLY